MTDIKKPDRTHLGHDQRIGVSRSLQLRLLEEIGRQAAKLEFFDELVFHGGTSLSLLHGSPRWSEDLDFMGTPQAIAALMGRRRQIEAALQLRASLEMPGAVVAVTEKRRNSMPEVGDVDKLMVRWEHPGVLGVVKVKAEFYATPAARLKAYEAVEQRPLKATSSLMQGIRAATPLAIWADKIIAMAQRPMLKNRDIHDLGYLHDLLDAAQDRRAPLQATMGIYGRSADEIRDGLEREFILAGIKSPAAFLDEMARWFTEAEMRDIQNSGSMERLYEGFKEEFAIGRGLVDDLVAADAVCKPDVACGF